MTEKQGLRLFEVSFKVSRPGDIRFAPDHFLHRQLGLDPWPATAIPARIIIHVHFQTQPLCLRVDMFEELAPFCSHEIDRTNWRSLIHFHDQHAADPDTFHGLQIRRNAVAGDIAVQPKPIHPRTSLSRRLDEALFQGIGRSAAMRQTEKQKHDTSEESEASSHNQRNQSRSNTKAIGVKYF